MKKIPELVISSETVAAILAKARQFDVKDVVTDPDSSSNPSTDAMLSVLEDHANDPVRTELTALTWLGRGDGDLDDWDDVRMEAARARNKRTAEYLLGIPLLGDYLEEALSQFGHFPEEFERQL